MVEEVKAGKTLEELKKEYGEISFKLGLLVYQKFAHEKDISSVLEQMLVLNKEHAELQKKTEEKKDG